MTDISFTKRREGDAECRVCTPSIVHLISVEVRLLDCAGSTEDQIGTDPVIICQPLSKRLAHTIRRIVHLVVGGLDQNPGPVIWNQPI